MARPGDAQQLVGGRPVAPFDIIRAAHAELVVRDLGRSREFYVDRLGFVVADETPDALYLRAYEDRHHHCLALHRGDVPAVRHLAFLVASEQDVDDAAAHFRASGRMQHYVSEGVEPGQGRAVRVLDPLGFPIELFAEMEQRECLLQRYDRHRGARVQRIDHFNLHVPDIQAAFDYYFSELGFRCSEYIAEEDGADGQAGELLATWMFRKPSVHDVGLTAGAGPRLHHLGFWVADTDAILNVCDALGGGGGHGAIERGPGRHGVSNAFYLYLRDPDGHRVELYTGDYWTGDPDLVPKRWSVTDDQRRSFWGHEVPARWYRESSRVLDLHGDLVPVGADDSAEALRGPVLPG
jgi:3,4-dihydroxyphenylacetate 2,3-dioxygenase